MPSAAGKFESELAENAKLLASPGKGKTHVNRNPLQDEQTEGQRFGEKKRRMDATTPEVSFRGYDALPLHLDSARFDDPDEYN